MEQRYSIRDGLGFCRFERRTIILDIAADRYWQLDEDAGKALEALGTGSMAGISERALARLVTLGFLAPVLHESGRTEDLATSRSTPLPPPSSSALEQPAMEGCLEWGTACEVAALAIAARLALRRWPLKTILDQLKELRRRTRAPRTPTSLEEEAQSFWRCRRLVPLQPLCLPDSVAFVRFAMRRGHAPHIVFGVEAFPFTAHCWVQDGSVVLTDALDHANRFKPILVL